MAAPSPVLHVGAQWLCAHGGRVVPVAASSRVRVGGQPVLTTAVRCTVAGCPHGPPCLEGRVLAGAARVRVDALPVAVAAGAAVGLPSGGPLVVVAVQARVRAA